jgi:hypothetical protein
MKKISILFIALLTFTTGCVLPLRTTRVIGSGNSISEGRNVSDFNSISLSGIGTLLITQGSKESLKLTAEDNIIEYLQSNVVGNNLRLDVRDFVYLEPTEDIIYELTVVDLEKVDLSGLGDIKIESLKTSRLIFDISGSGDAELFGLDVNSLIIEISGLGNVMVAGEAETQRVNLSGAGFYEAENLHSHEAKILISGAGKAVIWVESDLDIVLSGLGDFKYYGNPDQKSDISGLGTVESLGEK